MIGLFGLFGLLFGADFGKGFFFMYSSDFLHFSLGLW